MFRPVSSAVVVSRRDASLLFTSRIVPSSENDRKPHGAVSSSSSMKKKLLPGSGCYRALQVILDDLDRLVRMADMRAVAGRVHQLERTPGKRLMDVFSHRQRRDHIVRALHHQ